MTYRTRTIVCMESFWDSRLTDRLNVLPVLELLEKTETCKYIHLSCNTVAELEYNLRLVGRKRAGILYLAFHGSPGVIHVGKTKFSIDDLADIMGGRFKNWIIHLGSCSIFRKPTAVESFALSTQAALITGYTREVAWLESTAFELLLFQQFALYRSPRIICRNIFRKHSEFAEQLGFRHYPEY
jgi:hypothetical protein